MSHYIKQGNTFKVVAEQALDLHTKLPAGNYTISQDMFGNMFLEMIDGFTLPPKLYGNTTRHTGRILRTFRDRPNNTGVLLAGEKGSGKTLLAKSVSIHAAEMGISTIVINRPWKGDAFNGLIQAINQPAIILFDEFEKVYDVDDQQAILTLMDGVYQSNKLFMLTCNDKWRINKHMQNRPGRIFYYLEFAGLDDAFIRDYCEDNLNDKSWIDIICNMAIAFSSFNFDMLKALVEDMNRYEESPQDVMEILNARPEYSDVSYYEVELVYEGRPIPVEKIYNLDGDRTMQANPFGGVGLHFKDILPVDDGDGDTYLPDREISFRPEHLTKVDSRNGNFTFLNEDAGAMLRLRKKAQNTYNYWSAF